MELECQHYTKFKSRTCFKRLAITFKGVLLKSQLLQKYAAVKRQYILNNLCNHLTMFFSTSKINTALELLLLLSSQKYAEIVVQKLNKGSMKVINKSYSGPTQTIHMF